MKKIDLPGCRSSKSTVTRKARCTGLALSLLVAVSLAATTAAQTGPDRLLWPEMLKEAGLRIVWHSDLPLVKGEKLDRLIVLKDRLYGLTDRNYLFSLDRTTGKTVFSRSFAAPGLVVLGFSLYRDRVLSVVGNELIELDPNSGATTLSKGMEFGVSCLPARNDSFYYVPGVDGRLRAFRVADRVKMFEAAAPSRSAITAVAAEQDMVAFATAVGEIIVIRPDAPQMLWQFKAGDRVTEPITAEGQVLFAASADTYVYRLDTRRPIRPVWRCQVPALLSRGPMVSRDAVYQPIDDKGIVAIDKTTGSALWKLENAVAVLAETAEAGYVLKKPAQLVVVNRKTGKSLRSVNFAPVRVYAVNPNDSRLYVADDRGRILCLVPLE